MLTAWIACFACYCPQYRQFRGGLKCADVINSLIYISLLISFLIYSGRTLIDSADIIVGMRIDAYSLELFISVVEEGSVARAAPRLRAVQALRHAGAARGLARASRTAMPLLPIEHFIAPPAAVWISPQGEVGRQHWD